MVLVFARASIGSAQTTDDGGQAALQQLPAGQLLDLTRRDHSHLLVSFQSYDSNVSIITVIPRTGAMELTRAIPTSEILRIEYQQKRHTSPQAIIGGGLIGAVVGFVIGSVTNMETQSATEFSGEETHKGALYGTIIGAAAGVIAGVVIPPLTNKVTVIEL